jgi:hypothetical protein
VGADDAGGFRLPGVYRKLLEADCEEFCRPDPRRYLEGEPADWERLKTQGQQAAAVMLEAELAVGEPIVVPACRIGGNTIPVPKDVTMFRPSSVRRWFRVTADDVITPSPRPKTEFRRVNPRPVQLD